MPQGADESVFFTFPQHAHAKNAKRPARGKPFIYGSMLP
jgi:hypothetical protein